METNWRACQCCSVQQHWLRHISPIHAFVCEAAAGCGIHLSIWQPHYVLFSRYQVEKPPAYDRAVDELLALPVDLAAAAAAVMPGGAAAARRRQLAEACLGDGAAADGALVKRRRLAPQRCFNCGSYAHNLQACLKPLDQVLLHPGWCEQHGHMRNFFLCIT